MKKHSLLCTALFFSMHSYGLTTTQAVNFNDDEVGQYQKDDFKKDWLTGMYSSQSGNLYITNLSDSLGNAHHNAFQVIYPAQDVGGSAGVAIPIPLSNDLSTISYDHLFFQYDVMFPSNFTPPPEGGGKLPGLTSDNNESGCVKNTPGFSSRYMWRRNSMEMYLYLYSPNKQADCGDYIPISADLESDDNAIYHLPLGTWVTLTQEVQLNTNGQSNGYIRVWVNGVLKLEKTGLTLIANGQNLQIDYAELDAFPGGSEEELEKWAFDNEGNSTYFDNFIVSQTNPLETNSLSMKKKQKQSNTKAQKKKVTVAKQKHLRTQ